MDNLRILDKKEVVRVDHREIAGGFLCFREPGKPVHEIITPDRLAICYRVTILPDGRAKSENAYGSEPNYTVWTEEQESELYARHDKWVEAEDNRKTLRMSLNTHKRRCPECDALERKSCSVPDCPKTHIVEIGQKYFAFLSSESGEETFVLVKPITEK